MYSWIGYPKVECEVGPDLVLAVRDRRNELISGPCKVGGRLAGGMGRVPENNVFWDLAHGRRQGGVYGCLEHAFPQNPQNFRAFGAILLLF